MRTAHLPASCSTGTAPRRDGAWERFDGDGRWNDPPVPWRTPGEGDLTAVAEAIARLPVPERVVLTLRDVQGLGAEDACALLDVDLATLLTLLDGARRRLRVTIDRRLRARARNRPRPRVNP